MPEFRKDPVVGRWVLVSAERGNRPSDYASPPKREVEFCPLCPGNEFLTPPEIFAFREKGTRPDGPGWSIRVVPTKFPLCLRQGGMNRQREGLFEKMNGIGCHEVVIESPDHNAEMADLPLSSLKKLLFVFKLRIEELSKNPRFRYVIVSKRRGKRTGTRGAHSCSHILALPIVPREILEELNGGKQYHQNHDHCIYCTMLQEERRIGTRIIDENRDFITFAPFAARFPFETWIMPKAHMSNYTMIQQPQYQTLAETLSTALKKLDRVLGLPPFYLVFHSAPILGEENLPYYHWHIEIVPKVSRVDGHMYGAGFYVNPTLPEHAAAYLREVSAA